MDEVPWNEDAWSTVRRGLLMMIGAFSLAMGMAISIFSVSPYLAQVEAGDVKRIANQPIGVVDMAMIFVLASSILLGFVVILFGQIRCLNTPGRAKAWLIGALGAYLLLLLGPCCVCSHPQGAQVFSAAILLSYAVLLTAFLAEIALRFGNTLLVAGCGLFLVGFLAWWIILIGLRRIAFRAHEDLFQRHVIEFLVVMVLLCVWHMALLWSTRRSIPTTG